MVREFIGLVSEDEKNSIMTLHEREKALRDLLLIPNITDELYEKIIKDLAETRKNSEEWWRRMANSKMWKSVLDGHWNIDFLTNEIFLISN